MTARTSAILLALATAAWSAAWFDVARQQYRLQRVCDLFAGPWLPCGPHEWQTPLALALAAPALLAAALVVRALRRACGRRTLGRHIDEPEATG